MATYNAIIYNGRSGATEMVHLDNIVLESDSAMTEAIMGERKVTLHFKLDHAAEDLRVGDYIYFPEHPADDATDDEIAQARFDMNDAPEVVVRSAHEYEYTLTFTGTQSQLARYAMTETEDVYNPATRHLERKPTGNGAFSITGPAALHLDAVCNAMKLEGGWKVGSVDDRGEERCLTYGDCTAAEALNMIADAFGSEWYVYGRTIGLARRQVNASSPLSLSYGRGNGLLSGVAKRVNQKSRIRALYVRGGDRNIVKNDYGELRLMLPYAPLQLPQNRYAYIGYDGTFTSLEDGYNPLKNVFTCKMNNRRAIIDDFDSGVDAFFSNDDIYPAKTLRVLSVGYDYKDAHYENIDTLLGTYTELNDQTAEEWDDVSVVIETDEDNINYNNYKIQGETMTITFQSGALSGKTFNVTYAHNAVKRGTTTLLPAHRFIIQRTNIDGISMPQPPFAPESNDRLIVYGIKLPSEYYTDAENKLLNAAVRHLWENNRGVYTLDATIDGIWATNRWAALADKLVLGGIVSFTDPAIQPEPLSLRIRSITWPALRLHAPDCEMESYYVGVSKGKGLKSNRARAAKTAAAIEATYHYIDRSVGRGSRICTTDGNTTYLTINDTMCHDSDTTSALHFIFMPPYPVKGQRVDIIKASAAHDTQLATPLNVGGFLRPGGVATTSMRLQGAGAWTLTFDGANWLSNN